MALAKITISHTVSEFLTFQIFESCSPLLESQRLIYLIVHIVICTIHFIIIINISKYLIISMNSKFIQDEYHTADE